MSEYKYDYTVYSYGEIVTSAKGEKLDWLKKRFPNNLIYCLQGDS